MTTFEYGDRFRHRGFNETGTFLGFDELADPTCRTVHVRFDDGREGSTFDEKLKEIAESAKTGAILVVPTLEQKGKYVNLTGLSPMGLGDGKPADAGPTIIINANQVKRFHTIATGHGWTDAERDELLKAHGYGSSTQITVADYEGLVDTLKERQK